MSLKDWDKLLSVLPISLHIVSIFKFIGTQNIQLSSDGITFRGFIKTDQNITKYRKLYLYRDNPLHNCRVSKSISKCSKIISSDLVLIFM